MRFHKFETRSQGLIWIDLDQVHGLKAGDFSNHTKLATPSGFAEVMMPVDDVLALISPPAKPDTYEEQLAKVMPIVRARYDASTPQWVRDQIDAAEDEQRARNIETMKAREAAKADIPEAMSSSDRAARLDELERMMDALCYPGVVTYYHRRRKELA